MPSIDRVPYSYRPLATPSTGNICIRLLKLLPGQFHHDIHITLREVSIPERLAANPANNFLPKEFALQWHLDHQLAGGTENVDAIYEALSYVWGTSQNPRVITVDTPDQYLLVTQNLDSALRHLRSEMQPRTLWVDAICINQDDLSEKDSQVRVMSHIYHSAERVVAWLGEEKDNSCDLIQYLHTLGLSFDIHWDSKGYSKENVAPNQKFPYDIQTAKSSLYKFLYRPWFERVWIRQEIAFAKQVNICNGFKSWPLKSISDAIFALTMVPGCFAEAFAPLRNEELGYQERLRLVFETLMTARTSLHILQREGYHWSNIRATLTGVRSTDPRDKIYGVWSLLDDAFHALDFRIDYSASAEALLIDMACRFIQSGALSAVLRMCALPDGVSALRPALDLPSWVPDLTSDLPTGAAIATVGLRPERISKPTFELLSIESRALPRGSQDLTLRVAGRHIDTVLDVLPLTKPLNADSAAVTLSRAWHFVIGNEAFASRYSIGESSFSAFFEAVGYGRRDEVGRVMSDTETQSRYKEMHNLLIRGLQVELSHDLTMFLSMYLNGQALFVTESGQLGLGSGVTKKGDIFCYLLGCSNEMILRPWAEPKPDPSSSENNRSMRSSKGYFLVVGSGIIKALAAGKAMFGPLPESYSVKGGLNVFVHESTGEAEFWDPRVLDITGQLGDETFDVEAYKKECNETNGEPKEHLLSAEHLEKAGIEIEYFDII